MSTIVQTTAFLRSELGALSSEQRHPDSSELDVASSLQIVQMMNQSDRHVCEAVATEVQVIARVVDEIVHALRAGGRLIYVGAGTSGRLGVMDAAECPPTFSVAPTLVCAVMAGGREAMFEAVEGAEDNPALAISDLRAIRLNSLDVVVGITASGRTPYVIGGVDYANQLGCVTVALTCNHGSRLAAITRHAITTVVGPEILTGSTRLKSASAHKMVLNMLTTASMVKLGKCFHNLMVDLKATNEKLRARAINIVMNVADCDEATAVAALQKVAWHVKPAMLMIMAHIDEQQAARLLHKNDGSLRAALAATSSI